MTPERKKTLWKRIIEIIVTAVVSLTTALTATSCMQVNKSTDETDKSVPMYVQPQEKY
jgi:hypothetical protein